MKKSNLIWLGYADLMTSLFFVMLVMFVVAFTKYIDLSNKVEGVKEQIGELEVENKQLIEQKNRLRVSQEKFKKINEITTALDKMSDESYFRFNKACKRHELVHGGLFDFNSFVIKGNQKPMLIQVGRELASIINQVKVEDGVQYMLVIEGRAGRFEDEEMNSKYNTFAKRLSYERAKALYDLWIDNYIRFDEDLCQVIISGSGFEGSCRYARNEEIKNRSFVIQLIPKVGEI